MYTTEEIEGMTEPRATFAYIANDLEEAAQNMKDHVALLGELDAEGNIATLRREGRASAFAELRRWADLQEVSAMSPPGQS